MIGQPNSPWADSPIERVPSAPAQFNISNMNPTAIVKKRVFIRN